MELIVLAKMIHENAVAHGWWEGNRSVDEVLALVHSEWSEALEEYRAGRPMVYHVCTGGLDNIDCDGHPSMEIGDVCMRDEYKKCNHRKHKPEGIAVELVDGVIRILDYFGKHGVITPEVTTVEQLVELASDKLKEVTLPELVAALHYSTSLAYGALLGKKQDFRGHFQQLFRAAAHALAWIEMHGYDYHAVLMEKHEYNKTRPYKHGGKVC